MDTMGWKDIEMARHYMKPASIKRMAKMIETLE
jgi:hypothetical protein